MSEESISSSCASCDIAANDYIKLKNCDDCDLVRYCSDECQKEHKSQHEEACKNRAAELRDELLFKQPESSNMGDCPICCLPLHLDQAKSTLMTCCSKIICDGCQYLNEKREVEAGRQPSCPFCRESAPSTDEECEQRIMKRIEKNDPVAMCQEGVEQCKKGEYIKAIEYWTKAAELGDANAHFNLSIMYLRGLSVEKDSGKAIHHLEEAAIAGHPIARYNLGCVGMENGNNTDRAVRHWIIAATQGYTKSTKKLMDAFKRGFVGKDNLAAALRAHQAAVDATKSAQREEAEWWDAKKAQSGRNISAI